jgi:3-oxoacyl-[acyl-carrier-protein] synthase-1
MSDPLVVVSVGARTPLGLDAQSSCYVYRTHAAAMQQSPLLDPEGEPATFCSLATLDPYQFGTERLCSLAEPAMREAIEGIPEAAAQLRFKLFVALDEVLDATEGGAQAAYDVVARMSRVASAKLNVIDSAHNTYGAAGLGATWERLSAELHAGDVDALLIGGLHSDYDPARIRALAEGRRLFSREQLDGIIPGEAAAFAIVMKASRARSLRLRPQVVIGETAAVRDKIRPDNDESAFEATGLTFVVRKVGDSLAPSGKQVGWLITDLSAETFRHYELQAVSARTRKLWCAPEYLDAPAQRMGYLGAAAMPFGLVLAAEAWRGEWAPHDVAMLIGGSDFGDQSAMLLTEPA